MKLWNKFWKTLPKLTIMRQLILWTMWFKDTSFLKIFSRGILKIKMKIEIMRDLSRRVMILSIIRGTYYNLWFRVTIARSRTLSQLSESALLPKVSNQRRILVMKTLKKVQWPSKRPLFHLTTLLMGLITKNYYKITV